MARKLYHIGFDKINRYILENRKLIKEFIQSKERFELYKVFGRAYFEIAIENFIKKFKIDKDLKYALYILNQLKSNSFIHNLYTKLQLRTFEEKSFANNSCETILSDYQKSIFYIFVYFLHTDNNSTKESIKEKLFITYFFYYVSGFNNPSNININYKDMTLSYIKGKDIVLKESYKIEGDKAIFKILINQKAVINLEGKSIKSLRKKAYKKIFFYLIDNQ